MTIYRQISNSNVSNKYVFGITYFNWVANQDPIFEIIFLYKPNKVRQWPVRNYNRNHRVGSIDFHPQQLLSASIHSHHNSTLRHKNRYYWNLTKAIRIRIYKDRNFIIGYLCFFRYQIYFLMLKWSIPWPKFATVMVLSWPLAIAINVSFSCVVIFIIKLCKFQMYPFLVDFTMTGYSSDFTVVLLRFQNQTIFILHTTCQIIFCFERFTPNWKPSKFFKWINFSCNR